MKEKTKLLMFMVLLICLVGCNSSNDNSGKEDVQDKPQNNDVVQDEKEEVETIDYLLEDSDSVLIQSIDLCEYSREDLRLIRNEIYARHGLKFQSKDLNEYFTSKKWYSGKFDELPAGTLSIIEQKNIRLITELEKIMKQHSEVYVSAWGLDDVKVEDNHLMIYAGEETMQSFIEFTESWDYLLTAQLSLELDEDCTYAYSAPGVYNQDYSDNEISTQDEIIQSLQEEIKAIKDAKKNDEPYDTSVGLMIIIDNQKITNAFRVSS